MTRGVVKLGAVVAVGLLFLSNQGCSKKWVQSESEGGSGSTSSKTPTISGGSSSGELKGLSRNPSEERLSPSGQGGSSGQGGHPTSLNPSSVTVRQQAELTKEERAAVEAGLQDVFFGYDQWTLSETGIEALNHDADYLKNHPGAVLKIEGHCDERGTGDYNMVLGDKRAKAARSYLQEAGVSPHQLAIVSYGKERPFCSERQESCYQQNRRGHMLLSTQ